MITELNHVDLVLGITIGLGIGLFVALAFFNRLHKSWLDMLERRDIRHLRARQHEHDQSLRARQHEHDQHQLTLQLALGDDVRWEPADTGPEPGEEWKEAE